ncbi:MAG: alkyl hydroperoxide reductase [Planctomycetota bacterium]|nr:MAG: alkyl hydroperoxide reductase [Planctomycetota bacterium]
MKVSLMKNYLFLCFTLLLSINIYCSDKKAPKVPSYQEAADKLNARFKSMKMPEGAVKIMEASAKELKNKYPVLGLKIGDKAPNFVLKDENGKEISLEKELKKGPVIINFYRGGWCSFCNIELQTLEKSLPLFKKYNAQIISICPQKPEQTKAQKLKNPFSFPVLFDADYKVIKEYKLFNEIPKDLISLYKNTFKIDVDKFNGKGRTNLPSPGIVVVNKAGIVVGSFAHTDYKKRMEPAAIIAALKK